MFTLLVVPLLLLLAIAGTIAVYRLPGVYAGVLLGSAWIGYAIYEALMQARILCSGECNIRVDLLLIWPALLLSTGALITSVVVRRWRKRAIG
jgi:hypothetical protein